MNTGKTQYYKQNRLKQLRAFCQTARSGNISQAARELYLSQPSISLQIQALEREFATTLFERRGPLIKLTPAGEHLYQMALPLVQGIDQLHDRFAQQTEDAVGGELNIAAGESTILYILPEPIKRFAARYPGVHLKLHNVTGRDGLALLRADETDFAVGSMLEVPRDISYQPIVTYEPTLITALDHPLAGRQSISLQDISPYGLILPPRHLSTWRIVDLVFSQHKLSYQIALEAGGWEVIKKYVELGLGISIVTDVCLTGEERLARLSLRDYFPQRSYGLVLRQGKHLSVQAQRFIEVMNEVFAPDSGSE